MPTLRKLTLQSFSLRDIVFDPTTRPSHTDAYPAKIFVEDIIRDAWKNFFRFFAEELSLQYFALKDLSCLGSIVRIQDLHKDLSGRTGIKDHGAVVFDFALALVPMSVWIDKLDPRISADVKYGKHTAVYTCQASHIHVCF